MILTNWTNSAGLRLQPRDEVLRMIEDGVSMRGIARHFNVGVATIDRIKHSKVTA